MVPTGQKSDCFLPSCVSNPVLIKVLPLTRDRPATSSLRPPARPGCSPGQSALLPAFQDTLLPPGSTATTRDPASSCSITANLLLPPSALSSTLHPHKTQCALSSPGLCSAFLFNPKIPALGRICCFPPSPSHLPPLLLGLHVLLSPWGLQENRIPSPSHCALDSPHTQPPSRILCTDFLHVSGLGTTGGPALSAPPGKHRSTLGPQRERKPAHFHPPEPSPLHLSVYYKQPTSTRHQGGPPPHPAVPPQSTAVPSCLGFGFCVLLSKPLFCSGF